MKTLQDFVREIKITEKGILLSREKYLIDGMSKMVIGVAIAS